MESDACCLACRKSRRALGRFVEVVSRLRRNILRCHGKRTVLVERDSRPCLGLLSVGWTSLDKVIQACVSEVSHCVQIDSRIGLPFPVNQGIPSCNLSFSLIFSGAVDQFFNWKRIIIDWIVILHNRRHRSIELPVRGSHAYLIESMLCLMP